MSTIAEMLSKFKTCLNKTFNKSSKKFMSLFKSFVILECGHFHIKMRKRKLKI